MNDEILFADERDIPEEEMLLLMKAQDALDHLNYKKMPSRADADVIWRAISAEILSDARTAEWARWIAKSVVKDVIENTSPGRDDRALQALKLSGKGDAHKDQAELADALQWAEIVVKLSHLSENSIARCPTELAKIIHSRGKFRDLSVKILADRIRRRLAK